MQVVTDYLDDHPGQPARILVVDGAGFFDVAPGLNAGDFSVAYYADRTLSISWLRGKAYMEYVFQQTREYRDENGEQPYRNLEFDLVSLYDILPSQERPKFPLTVQDGALRKLLRPDVATRDFLKRVTTIQTRFKIKSADAAVVEEAARRNTALLRQQFVWGNVPVLVEVELKEEAP